MTDGSTELMQLRVTRSEFAAQGIRLFEFRDPEGRDLPVFTPGSHVTVQVPNGETRKYSLCNDPAEHDRYVIAVKREEDGRGGSRSMVDEVQTGDLVGVSAPRNDFELKTNRAGYIFIAGGIGITPILSMIRHLKAEGGPPFKLFYLSRSAETTAFATELTAPEFRGQVKIHYDNGDPDKSLDLWPVLSQPKGQHIYCCGPRPLMQAVRDMTGHWSSAAVHFESFIDSSQTHRKEDRPFVVHLARSGDSIDVPADRSILEVLRAHGYVLPSSCESGTCGTCRTSYLAGAVDHRDLVLPDSERSKYLMICVSRAQAGDLTLDL